MEAYPVDVEVKGMTHYDTVPFDDAQDLAGAKDAKLRKIRVWHNKYIYGIQ